MNAAHTPGPWETGSAKLGFTIKAGNRLVATAWRDRSAQIASEANARLIAEAPAMLEALRAVGDLLNTAAYNKFGKPMWLSIEAAEAREVVRLLAVRYGVPKAGSVCEQAGNVARAILARIDG